MLKTLTISHKYVYTPIKKFNFKLLYTRSNLSHVNATHCSFLHVDMIFCNLRTNFVNMFSMVRLHESIYT